MIKAVIFDAYGTLFSTGTGSVDAAARILEQKGRADISPREFYARWKALHRRHMTAGENFINEEEIFHKDLRALYTEYAISGNASDDVGIMLDTLGKRSVFPETKKVIDALRGKYIVCIGSTTDTAPLMNDIMRNGVCVDHIFTSESLRSYKPSSEFYTGILNSIGINAEEALFAGDSLTDDVVGPACVGMRTCWINRKGELQGDAKPDYVCDDLTGVIKALGIDEECL